MTVRNDQHPASDRAGRVSTSRFRVHELTGGGKSAGSTRLRPSPLLVLCGVLLTMPIQQLVAQVTNTWFGAADGPTDAHWAAYRRGLQEWATAQAARSERSQTDHWQRAETSLVQATDGVRFPEAELSLGLAYYSRNSRSSAPQADVEAYQAERSLLAATRHATGAVRAEAFTYLGVLALRQRQWSEAKAHFASALAEDPARTQTSRGADAYGLDVDTLRRRGAALRPAARVGQAFAAVGAATFPGRAVGNPAVVEAALAAVGAANTDPTTTAPGLESAGVALWQFAERPPDVSQARTGTSWPIARSNWQLPDSNMPPDAAASATWEQLATSVAIWGAGMLHRDPPAVNPATLPPVDRRNLMMALLNRTQHLLSEGRFSAAAPALVRLEEFPEAQVAARQQRIWMLLQGGGEAPDLAAASRVVEGAGAERDPLYASQMLLLGRKCEEASNPTRAREVYEKVTSFLVSAPDSPVRRRLLPLAIWNQASLDLRLAGAEDSTDRWKRGLQTLDLLTTNDPPSDYQQALRLHLLLRLAEAHVIQKDAAGAEAALARAARSERVSREMAEDERRPGGLNAAPLSPDVQVFEEYLAARVFREGTQDLFKDGFLKRSVYAARFYAARAATRFHALSGATPSSYTEVLRLLFEAQEWATPGSPLAEQLGADAAGLQDWAKQSEDTRIRRAFAQRWNEAAARTETARTATGSSRASAVKAAVDAWAAVRHDAAGGTPAELDLASSFEMRLAQEQPAPTTGSSDPVLAPASAYPPSLRSTAQRFVPGAPGLSRERWLIALARDEAARARLVQWINQGARAALRGQRLRPGIAFQQVSPDPFAPNYVVRYLRMHTREAPRVLSGKVFGWRPDGQPPGGALVWKPVPLGRAPTVFVLDNGIPVVEARTGTPIAPILLRVTGARRAATAVADVPAPPRTSLRSAGPDPRHCE